jgi:hypothetical protein
MSVNPNGNKVLEVCSNSSAWNLAPPTTKIKVMKKKVGGMTKVSLFRKYSMPTYNQSHNLSELNRYQLNLWLCN